MKNKDLKIIYISGWGRSGSTILANVLHALPVFFNVGESCFASTDLRQKQYLYTCGSLLHDCPVWGRVLPEALDTSECYSLRSTAQLARISTSKALFFLLQPDCVNRELEELKQYASWMDTLYKTVSHVTDARVLVDSSKFPSMAYALLEYSSLDVTVIHLVRDPRGTAYSWKKKIKRSDTDQEKQTLRYNTFHQSVKWLQWNFTLDRLRTAREHRATLVRYEDFSSRPYEVLEDILNAARISTDIIPISLKENKIKLRQNHTVRGNPNKRNHGMTRIVPDTEWRDSLSVLQRATVTMPTFPLLLKYGYSGSILRHS